MGCKCSNLWHDHQSAYVPSVAQMRLMYAMKGAINHVIIECGGSVAEHLYLVHWMIVGIGPVQKFTECRVPKHGSIHLKVAPCWKHQNYKHTKQDLSLPSISKK